MAAQIVSKPNPQIVMLKDGNFLVPSMSDTDIAYTVTLSGPRASCTCSHFFHRLSAQEKGDCKHIKAVRQAAGKLRWERYVESARRLSPEQLLLSMRRHAHQPELFGALVVVWNERKRQDARTASLKAIFA